MRGAEGDFPPIERQGCPLHYTERRESPRQHPRGATSLLDEIASVGRDRVRGGYSRHAFDAAEGELRTWFIERAGRLGLDVETDRNGNLWAWWGTPGPDAVVTGSHLDSVPGGGAFDGPLGVLSALDAVATLQTKGFVPAKPFAVVVFAQEEGGRFGVACLGSRLLAGTIDADKARALRDTDGVTLAEAAARVGLAPQRFGADPETMARIGRFIELHVEQGRGLIDLGSPVAVGSTVIAHGRWRFSFRGQGNHAGTTLIGDRHDPMLPWTRGRPVMTGPARWSTRSRRWPRKRPSPRGA